jgi:hypothetical protein
VTQKESGRVVSMSGMAPASRKEVPDHRRPSRREGRPTRNTLKEVHGPGGITLGPLQFPFRNGVGMGRQMSMAEMDT